MYGDRNQLRKVFYDCWQARHNKATLDAMQQVIVRIIEQHPEYHQLLETPDAIEHDFPAEQGKTNPFLHMSMHIALAEQLSTDRPEGIRECYQGLLTKHGSAHAAEHEMMECLGEALWQAQRNQQPPDDSAYLSCLMKRAGLKSNDTE